MADFEIDESLLDKIDIIDISGSTYKGKMMIIYDPSRINLAVNLNFDDANNVQGHYVE